QLDGANQVLVGNELFVNGEPVEAAAVVGIEEPDFGTYALTETQLDSPVDMATITQVDQNNPAPIGCQALIEPPEPGALPLVVTGFIENLPDTLDKGLMPDDIEIDVGLCVLMDSACGVDGIPVNDNVGEIECEVANAFVPAEFINMIPLEIEKAVECELQDGDLETCIDAGFANDGDFAADRYDMNMTQFNGNVMTGFAIVNHTQFIPASNDPNNPVVEAAALVGLAPGFNYTLTELQAVDLDDTIFPVDNIPDALCNDIELEPGTQLIGSIDTQNNAIVCVSINDSCVNGFEVTENSTELECEVSNTAIAAEET
ncbi:MAG: hypothetical protein ACPKQO_03665, partial [Nitrososphaeraceae archaeon]